MTKLTTAFLIIINGVAILTYMLFGVQNALQMSFILPMVVVILAISSFYHVILWLFTRKKELKIVVRIPMYLLPVILLVFLGLSYLKHRIYLTSNRNSSLTIANTT
jgi:hypothetical protein